MSHSAKILKDELKPPRLQLDDQEKALKAKTFAAERAAVLRIQQLQIQKESAGRVGNAFIEEELSRLVYSPETCLRIKEVFRDEMIKGLRGEPSSLQMANTYASEIPEGTEEGKFLTLDLGGTNFRVLLVEFKAGQMADFQAEHYHISDELRLGPGKDLFDYLAECVCNFLARKQLKAQSIPLGFTFSFPMLQNSLRSGILVKWTKSFNCSGVEGKDVVKLLNEALCRKGCYNVSVHAVLNDTTGTFMMGAYMDKKTCIGLILGTGCNACYLEKSANVKKWETKHNEEQIIIDVEWGALGDNGVLDFIQTDFDIEVDANSLLVNSFTFEKYISGNYLGEVARVVLVNLVKKGMLFGGYLPNALNKSGSFSSVMVSRIEESAMNNTEDDILQLLETFGIRQCSHDDLLIVQHVCFIVSSRSALLVSICLAELINWVEKPEVIVAVDGSLYQKHPRYQLLMDKYLKLFTQKKHKMMEVFDGSGRGAALLLAIAMRLEERLRDF